MTDSLSQYCPNCEAQANTIEELRAANERWAIAFKQAEERANGRIEALQADNAKLREALANLANRINIVGSPYDQVQKALDQIVIDTKRAARAALQETGQ